MTPAFRLEGVRQRYGGRTVLDLAELEIRRGEILALVGPSGSGKSTLLRLLNFLERPTEGRIHYQGRPTDGERTPLELRRQVTTVFQQTALQKASVRSNVAYGLRLRGQRVDGQVQGLLETVGLGKLAGSPARLLSGGEKQRVALARVILKDPRILVLDEATSHLDSESEMLIQEALKRVMAGRTSIVIAHRLSTILAADVILVMDRGRIVERGTHRELLAQGGLYSQLYETQFSREREAV
jgi:ATP-binding cassette subfamily B protein